jgi:2-hydroxychromene-2-carboxylate isomerase
MSSPLLQFWFEFASTYSYLAAMRVERATAEAGIAVEWKPFLLGPIFQQQGWNDSPFNLYPVKGRYMWRDMERLCEKYAIPLRKPSRFPRNGLLAARLACLASGEPWCAEFVRRVYRANFAEDREISDPAVIIAIVDSLSLNGSDLIVRAQSAETKERLRQQTDEAMRLGIFGAPAFVIGNELFWGNDRLEDAIAWHRRSLYSAESSAGG